MKKTVLIALAALVALGANAQQKSPGDHRHHQHKRSAVARQLNLTAGQQQQAKLINEDFRKKMQDLNKNESITVKEYRDRKEQLHREHKAKLDGLLTAEQKARKESLKADRQKQRDAHYAQRLNRMQTALQLSDAQVSQLKAHRESMGAKMKALRENEKLSREERKQQMMALKEEAKAGREKILTPEQVKKMDELHKKRFGYPPAR